MSQETSFSNWKRAIDAEVASRCMLSADDLPDVDYWGLYVTGNTPQQAAIYAIRNAMDEDTDDESEPFEE